MRNPHFAMAMVYAMVAALAALDAALTSYGLISPINSLRWLRVHFVSLGIMVQLIFGALPGLAAWGSGTAQQAVRWDVWAALNVGLPILLVGMPTVNQPLIFAGGSLVLLAALLLARGLADSRSMLAASGAVAGSTAIVPGAGRRFYLAGVAYLCLGVVIGTGIWLGWTGPLQMSAPIEVHIHANNWGFMALVFAGLVVDLYPEFAGRALAWPGSVPVIFWIMVVGALGLVLGPWLGSSLLTGPGMLLHLLATVWLLANVVRPLFAGGVRVTAGMSHLVLAYVWMVAPLMAAPFILMGAAGFPAGTVEQNAPQALIYGWVLQFGFAMGPFLLGRLLSPGTENALGGSWLSVIIINLGCVALWVSIFNPPLYGLLHGTAYSLWALSLLPFSRELWLVVTRPTPSGAPAAP